MLAFWAVWSFGFVFSSPTVGVEEFFSSAGNVMD